MTNKKRLHRLLVLIIPLLLLGVGMVSLYLSEPPKRVWVIHSHDAMYEQYKEYNQLLAKELRSHGVRAELSFNYLDCNRYIEIHEDSIMNHWIDSVSQRGSWPDLIITTEDQSTYALLMTHREELKRCPILFGGVRFPNYRLYSQFDNLTGVRDTVDVVKSISVMHELTGSQHVYTNLDLRFFDRQAEAMMRQQLKGQPVLTNFHWEYPIRKLYNLSKDSLSITGLSMRYMSSNVYTPKGGRLENGITSPDQSGSENFFWTLGPTGMMYYLLIKFDATSHTLAIMSLRQQFSGINNLFGTSKSGILAGYFSAIPTWAHEQAEMAAEIFKGRKPSEIPYRVSQKDYYLDWAVAKKYQMPLSQIPPKYHLVNIPYQTLHPYIYWSLFTLFWIVIIGSLAVAITAAIRSNRQQRIALGQLKEKQSTLEIASTFNQSFVWRTVGKEAEFDDAFWRFIGQEPCLVNRQMFQQWINPKEPPIYLESTMHNIADKQMIVQLSCDFTGSGHYSWWEMRAMRNQEPDGTMKMFGLIFNIDGIKSREAELIEARKQVEEANLKESFLANMSHEIRTPLNAIVGFSNILATPGMELEDEEKEDMITTINKNNDLLLKLINDILDLSRIESGYMQFNFEDIEVNTFVDSVYKSYEVQAPHHLEFIYQPSNYNLVLHIDKARAQQVMMNFLTNAAKFTPKGSITLGWNYHKERQEAEIYVEDTGIGLSKTDCSLIFGRFFKKDEFKQGTGLGLSICRVIAEKLKGRITVNSEVGRGSRFSIWLKVTENQVIDKPIGGGVKEEEGDA